MHPAAARIKAAALRRIGRLVPPGARLLDVGCGTGREAFLLAKRGYHVMGVDLSPQMIDIAEERRRENGVSQRCQFHLGSAAELEAVTNGARFDGAYSFYAVLNLEPRVNDALLALARSLPARAPLVVGLLNPTALFELGLYPFLGRLKGIRKATQYPVRLKLERGGKESVDCYLYSISQFAHRAAPYFELEEAVGLHIFLPPPWGPLLQFPRLLRALNRIEERIGSRAPWNRLGYMSLLTFRRTEVLAS